MNRLTMIASIAPASAKENATATMEVFDREANVGCERGSESPIAVSAVRASRAGRNTDSEMLWPAINCSPVPKRAPMTAY